MIRRQAAIADAVAAALAEQTRLAEEKAEEERRQAETDAEKQKELDALEAIEAEKEAAR